MANHLTELCIIKHNWNPLTFLVRRRKIDVHLFRSYKRPLVACGNLFALYSTYARAHRLVVITFRSKHNSLSGGLYRVWRRVIILEARETSYNIQDFPETWKRYVSMINWKRKRRKAIAVRRLLTNGTLDTGHSWFPWRPIVSVVVDKRTKVRSRRRIGFRRSQNRMVECAESLVRVRRKRPPRK